MRLRPSGNSGPLVSSLAAFEHYQAYKAWTWEHQALVRARAVAGDKQLAERFDQVRHGILQQHRNKADLATDVVKMRQKMRDHLGSKPADEVFHLKQDQGGIVDIEFMVQYAVLAGAERSPALARYTDNIRILGCLSEAEVFSTEQVEQLIEAYKAFRSMGHRLALQGQASTVDKDLFLPERQHITALWQHLFTEVLAE